jgi:hypothetical protein
VKDLLQRACDRIDPTGEMDLPQLTVSMQITIGLASIHSVAVFGGEFYQSRVLGTAALAGARTLVVDLALAASGELFVRMLAPVAGAVGAWMAPGMSKLAGAIGEMFGIAADAVAPAVLREFVAATRVIAEAYDGIQTSLAAQAAGKKLGEESLKRIAAARLQVFNAVARMSPQARAYLRSQVKRWADPAAFSSLPGGFQIIELGGWKEFVSILLEFV